MDKARSRELGGTGLGLAIVKHLAEGMGAAVTVRSEPGRGTCFTVDVPARPAERHRGTGLHDVPCPSLTRRGLAAVIASCHRKVIELSRKRHTNAEAAA